MKSGEQERKPMSR